MRVCQSFIAAILLVALAAPVNADPSTTSRLGWVTNGDVRAAVQVGNTLYVGGTFTRVGPSSAALGSYFSVSTATGEAMPGLPLVDGVVNAIAPDGAGGYYIGGAFSSVGGVPRASLAHILSDGSVDPAFAPAFARGAVLSVAVGSSYVFVGGGFQQVNGTSRSGFVALNPTNGSDVAWPAFLSGDGRRIVVAGDNVLILGQARILALNQTTGESVWTTSLAGTANDMLIAGPRIVIAGSFVQGPPFESGGRALASLDVATGVFDPSWSASLVHDIREGVSALALSGSTLFVGGEFEAFGGQPRTNAAAVDVATGTVTSWSPAPNAPVSALAVSPSGTLFLGGSFTQVDGEARERFAEVDDTGNVSTWAPHVYASTVRTLRADVAGTLLVGAQVGVAGAQARTNLAAFDLSTDTLLPWAPAMSDDVTKLAALAGSVFIEASRLIPGPLGGFRQTVLFAVDAASGGVKPWTLPPSLQFVSLLGTHGAHVYINANFTGGGGGLLRLDPITAAIDPSWRPMAGGTDMAIDGGTMHLGGSAVDIASGTVSPWRPVLVPPLTPEPPSAQVTGLALDGRTVHLAVLYSGITGAGVGIRSFDAVSAEPVSWWLPTASPPLIGSIGAITVVDGQLIVGSDFAPWSSIPLVPGGAVGAFAANGQALAWNPGFTRIDLAFSAPNVPRILVTPTDVIVLGYNAVTPVPVQGIAVLPRTPSVAPASLRGTTVDNLVTLTWDAPSTPPAGGYVIDVGSEAGSTAPLSLPTGSQATSISAVAGNGTYYVRVRASGAPPGPASLPTNEIALVVGCDAPPTAPPLNLAAQMSGSNVTLTWTAPPFTSASRYVLEAGSSTGSTNIGRFTVNAPQTSIGGAVPPGTYFVRIHAANACGESTESSEIFFTVGSTDAIPPAPTGLVANVAGSSVGIQWTPSAGALGYVMEVGSAPGLTNIARLPLSAFNFFVTGVPNGAYHLRVRAGNAAGLSAPSSEVVIVVP